jgi:hypothetical protein
MPQVTATVEFDQLNGSVKFSLDLQGATELEHELLAAAIGTGRSVSLIPAHKQDELFVEFTIRDVRIWPTALRALENRHRKADGRPSLQQEEEAERLAKENERAALEANKEEADAAS